jgi:hypothetical protein
MPENYEKAVGNATGKCVFLWAGGVLQGGVDIPVCAVLYRHRQECLCYLLAAQHRQECLCYLLAWVRGMSLLRAELWSDAVPLLCRIGIVVSSADTM